MVNPSHRMDLHSAVRISSQAYSRELLWIGLESGSIFGACRKLGRRTPGAKRADVYVHFLVFKYKGGAHNVYKVTGDEFKSCTVPSNNSLGSFTGNDTIKLATAGTKWYICGISGHCDGGMKLKITVLDGAPAPAPSAASTLFAKATGFHVLLGMIFAIAAVTVV
ncbi:hypothetical protein V6N11_019210 [Hibiscus sabdariffa]|uniref:Phytocyanin domain-containing protein n=1 Tax=Hibiscus sabdariffa TaxID=183260 RepID=A0ABR2R291_9ROSI